MSFVFLARRQSYIIYIINADVKKYDKRYIAKSWIEEVFKDNPERRDFYIQVTPPYLDLSCIWPFPLTSIK